MDSTGRIVDVHTSKTVGSLLATMCGDVLGAAVESNPPFRIIDRYPSGLTDFAQTNRGFGSYTDDTQMTFALTRSLVQHGRCSARDCATEYAKEYEPHRGYGGNTHKILKALQRGQVDPADSGRMCVEEGSWANGGAMRIAPIGLAYRHAPPAVFKQAVVDALMCTHVHPVGIDGALVQAAAVAWLAKSQPSDPTCTPAALLQHLQSVAETSEMREELQTLMTAIPNLKSLDSAQEPITNWGERLRSKEWDWELELAGTLGGHFQIEAHKAAACALLAMIAHWGCPRDAIVAAVHYGGDTDTIGAMAGALAGALHGDRWLPDSWLQNLENGRAGRDELVQLALKLATLDCRA